MKIIQRRQFSVETYRDQLGIERTRQTTIPAIGRCDCGCSVTLGRFTCTCERCGTDYNSAGQRLAPREDWGSETGEHWSDIINAGDQP